MKPLFFAKPSDLRKWFEKNHSKETEVYVGYYKVASGKPSITWSESVDQALCFGWIDGVRNSIDEISYCNRFTPRKPTSTWSAINIKKVEDLTEKGLMRPAGIEAFKKLLENKSRIYSYEKEQAKLSSGYEKKFRANKKAWKFFQSLAPGYRKVAIHRIMDAKQEATRLKRLAILISNSEANIHIR
jgi:uncharacterized protein YdeI (YjbR/CyaY-like superfamily)